MNHWKLSTHELKAAQAKQVATILNEIPDDTPHQPKQTFTTTLPGDQRQLRGIPVVGARGVGGAISGSRPGSNLR